LQAVNAKMKGIIKAKVITQLWALLEAFPGTMLFTEVCFHSQLDVNF
jgi:hypothetical protein